MRLWLLGLLLFVAPPALAAPDCEPLDEDAFRTLFLDALAAIDRDDAALHASIVQEVRGRIQCLTFAPPPRLLADFLVGLAVVEFSKGGEWEDAMEAALRIRPNVDRLVSGAHPINRWEPSHGAEETGTPVPDGVVLYVDGLLADHLPAADGLYLVQKEDDGHFETRWMLNERVDLAWVNAPVDRPRRLETWAFVSGGLGLGGVGQSVVTVGKGDFEPWAYSDYLANDAWAGLMPFGRIDALASYGRFGLLGHAEISWANLTRVTAGSAYTGPFVTVGPLVSMAGFGVQSFDVFEGGCRVRDVDDSVPSDDVVLADSWETCRTVATPRSVALPFGYGGFWIRAVKPWRPQPQLLIGAGPSMGRVDLSVALEPPPSRRGARWRYAGSLTGAAAQFGRETSDYRVIVTPAYVRIGVQAGVVLGRVR